MNSLVFSADGKILYAAGGELLSGHSLKHVVAAFAAWPVIHAVALRVRGQNPSARGAAPLAFGRRA